MKQFDGTYGEVDVQTLFNDLPVICEEPGCGQLFKADAYDVWQRYYDADCRWLCIKHTPND